jgi:hypothetical protein
MRGLRTVPIPRAVARLAGRTGPPSPPRFTLQHTPQSPAAQEATELLQGRAAAAGEPLVTARPRAAKFFRSRALLIALARRFASQIPAPPLGRTPPPVPRLLAATRSPLLAGPVTLIGPPLRPPPRRPATRLAAIPRQRMPRLKRLLTALQQAKTSPTASPVESSVATRGRLLGRPAGIF